MNVLKSVDPGSTVVWSSRMISPRGMRTTDFIICVSKTVVSGTSFINTLWIDTHLNTMKIQKSEEGIVILSIALSKEAATLLEPDDEG